MTEWRDATAFVLPTAPPRGEQWLRGLSHSIGFRSDGYVFEEREAILHGEWGELGCRTQLVDDPAGTLLVISYFSRDFHEEVAEQPDRWRDFCLLFAAACQALTPVAAVTLGTISDDVLTDLRPFTAAVAAGDGVRLRSLSYALLYLSPKLDRAAREADPTAPAHLLGTGGRITWGWPYDDFPE